MIRFSRDLLFLSKPPPPGCLPVRSTGTAESKAAELSAGTREFYAKEAALQEQPREQDMNRGVLPMGSEFAFLSDGLEPEDRRTIINKVLVASTIFSSVQLSDLARQLEQPVHAVECVVARMITEGLLKAAIDAVGGFVDFEEEEERVLFDEQTKTVTMMIGSCSSALRK